MKASVWTSAVAITVLLTGAMLMKGQVKSQAIPDGPAPQTTKAPASSVFSGVTPGEGTTAENNGGQKTPDAPSATLPPPPPPPAAEPAADQPPPETPATGEGAATVAGIIRVRTTFVEVPVTVKDSKGNLVPGLTWRNFRVMENGQQQRMSLFTVDPFPISAAIVIDQSLPADTMKKVNDSLAALQGAFTPQDELAVYTYNNGPKLRTEFTGAQSDRVSVALQTMKTKGRDMGVPVNSGPLTQNMSVNGQEFDHNPTMHQGHSGSFITIPKEIHTLNDAILAAATEVSRRGGGRRRIVYVISDGKEQGSKASFKEVKQYLLTNKVSVYATLVGDSATWGLGFLDHAHIPFMMRDNILPQYASATGGQVDSEFRQNAIEASFQRIAEEVRLQYTIGYNSHVSSLDSRYRTIEVQVNRPGLTVIARPGYYPSATPIHP